MKPAVLAASLEVYFNSIRHRKAAQVVKNLFRDPRQAINYIKGKRLLMEPNQRKRISNISALAMYTEANLSKGQFDVIKRYMGYSLPNYNLVLEEKKKCYPPREGTTITDTSAGYNLQDL